MSDRPLESDWKCFTKHVSEWRERYLTRKNEEIIACLSDNEKSPTDQFWDAKQLMKDQAKILVDCLDGHSRSKMCHSLQLMYRYNLIEEPDLAVFSEELRNQILAINKGDGG